MVGPSAPHGFMSAGKPEGPELPMSPEDPRSSPLRYLHGFTSADDLHGVTKANGVRESNKKSRKRVSNRKERVCIPTTLVIQGQPTRSGRRRVLRIPRNNTWIS